MSRAAEMLGKMAPKAIEVGHIAGGITRITAEDIAFACAGIKGWVYYLLRAKYCNDVAAVYQALTDLATVIDRMEGAPEDYLHVTRVAAVAIEDAIKPNICPSCKGRGEKMSRRKALLVDCKRCSGIGRKDLSGEELAAEAKLPGVARFALSVADLIRAKEEEALSRIAVKVA